MIAEAVNMTYVKKPRARAKARKAEWYFSRGYPANVIAAKIGVHVNTITIGDTRGRSESASVSAG